jgi:hypothetical protein
MGCMLTPTLPMYAGESLTRAIISVFCILMKRICLFLRKRRTDFYQTHNFPLIYTIFEKSPSFLFSSLSLNSIPYIFAVRPVCVNNGSLHNERNLLACYASCPTGMFPLQYNHTFQAAHVSWIISLKYLPYEKAS